MCKMETSSVASFSPVDYIALDKILNKCFYKFALKYSCKIFKLLDNRAFYKSIIKTRTRKKYTH